MILEELPQKGVQEDERCEKPKNSHLSPLTSNKLVNIIVIRVLSIYNRFQFTYHRTSL